MITQIYTSINHIFIEGDNNKEMWAEAKVLEVDKTLMLTKFGYSEIPEEFIVIARKTGELSEKKREKVYKMFNETIDQFLLDEDEDEEEEEEDQGDGVTAASLVEGSSEEDDEDDEISCCFLFV